MAKSSLSLPGEKELSMRVPAKFRVIATSLTLAALSLASFVATALADSGSGPIPK
jgi:hypothetical protein